MRLSLSKADIERLLELLERELATVGVIAELHVVGGGVMCLALDAREATRDVDALFEPAGDVRAAAAHVAAREGLRSSGSTTP